MVESDNLDLDKSNGNLLSHQLTWPQLCGVSRVSGHAAKVLFAFSLISVKMMLIYYRLSRNLPIMVHLQQATLLCV